MEDSHHILFPRQEWELRPDAKNIRRSPLLIPRMNREVHNELHQNCPPVPLLGYYALQRILRDFHPQVTTLTTMDNLMEMIETSNGPRTHAIERHMAELAVWAIDLQRPFIAEGMTRSTYL